MKFATWQSYIAGYPIHIPYGHSLLASHKMNLEATYGALANQKKILSLHVTDLAGL